MRKVRGDNQRLASPIGGDNQRLALPIGGDSQRIGLDEQMPGWPPTGLTCLHIAARAGRSAAVGWLLDRGADERAQIVRVAAAFHDVQCGVFRLFRHAAPARVGPGKIRDVDRSVPLRGDRTRVAHGARRQQTPES